MYVYDYTYYVYIKRGIEGMWVVFRHVLYFWNDQKKTTEKQLKYLKM